MKAIVLIVWTMMLAACASQPPAPVERIPPGNLSLAEVRAAPERYTGSEVRWGGEITRVENKTEHTWIEVIGRELRSDARPKVDSRSEGRFIASIAGFADPAEYQVGHLLTVVGTLQEPVKRPIGEYQYLFPVVAVSGQYLWKPDPEFRDSSYPPPWWYYDPWLYYPRPYPYRW